MTFYSKNSEKKRILSEIRRRDEVVNSLCSMASRPASPRSAQEQEKRLRREIANSNERRRMQSINAGFQFLRSLLPQGDEKLSKASILTQTAEYIFRLEREKTMLLEQNCQLKRLVLSNCTSSTDSDSDSPFAKRKKLDAGDLSEEGLGAPRMPSPPNCENVEEMRREIQELTYTLECEKKIRIHLETRLKHMEAHHSGSEKSFDVALQDHASYHITETPRKHKSIDRLPKPFVNSMEAEDFHEVPDSSEHIVPEDLSGRRSSSLGEVSSSTVEASLHSSPPAFTVKLETDEAYAHSTSRQNLATIVEAIRHLEGDHMFRDDLPLSPASQSSSEELTERTVSSQNSDIDHVLTLQHQIIKNAPVTQSRPGVIVSKLS